MIKRVVVSIWKGSVFFRTGGPNQLNTTLIFCHVKENKKNLCGIEYIVSDVMDKNRFLFNILKVIKFELEICITLIFWLF